MKIILKSFWKAITSFFDNDPMTYSASLAFYTVVSLPAILMISINVLSTAYDRNDIKSDLLSQLNAYLGPSTVSQAEVILENAAMETNGIIPQMIGWGVLIFSATTVFISLQNGINTVWSVKPVANGGILKLLFDRLLSFAMIVSIGFVLLVSLVIDSMIGMLENWIVARMGYADLIIAWISNVALSLLLTTLVFALVFKVLPDVKTKWKNVWVGGFFTSLMFLFGKFFIGYYLSNADVGSPYGASGSLVIFLFWVYYSSTLVLFGAKFTFEYTMLTENRIEVSEHSRVVINTEISQTVVNTDLLE